MGCIPFMSIEWKEEYRTGFEKIDSQHLRLFECVTEMDSILGGGEINHTAVHDLMGFLTSYVKAHFLIEEKCMNDHGCPISRQNKEAHERFLQFYQEAVVEFQNLGVTREWLQKLRDVLKVWLVQHICRVDIHLKGCSGHSEQPAR